MRKQYRTYKPVVLRFRKWSRKAYAAFVSIHHTVNIGQLATYVADRFQAKNLSLHGNLCSSVGLMSADVQEQEDICEDETELLQKGISGFLCPVVFDLPVVASEENEWNNYNKS